MSITALSNAGSTQLLLASNLSGFQQAAQTLGRSLDAGNLSAARTAFTQLQQLNSNQSKLGGAPNAQLTADLTTLGGALKAGSLAAAQTAFAAVQKDLTGSNAQAVTAAVSAANQEVQQIDALLGLSDTSGATTSPSLDALLGSNSSKSTTPDIATQTTSILSGVYGNHSASATSASANTGTNLNVSA